VSALRPLASLSVPHVVAQRTPCADLWFKMVLDWQGYVHPCCFDWMRTCPIGYLADRRALSLLWHSDRMNQLRQAHLNLDISRARMCCACTAWAEVSEHDAYVDFGEASYFKVF